MSTTLLIRHGRTAANRQGVLAGRSPGVRLDGVGRRQARSLGARLRAVPLAVVVHSPLERCEQTARAITDARADDLETVPDERLNECDYGLWSGQPLRALSERPLWQDVQRQPSTVTFPGGESLAAMAERSVTAVRDWAARHPDGVVAVVTHGDVIKAVLSDALAQPFDEFQRIVVAPGSVSIVTLDGGRTAVVGVNLVAGRLPVAARSARPTVGGGAG